MAQIKYVDLNGLQSYDALIKALIGTIPEDAEQKNVVEYLEALITDSEFSGEAGDVTIKDEGDLVTATEVEGAIQELATNIATLNGDATTAGSVAKSILDKVGELKIDEQEYATVKAYVDAVADAIRAEIVVATEEEILALFGKTKEETTE